MAVIFYQDFKAQQFIRQEISESALSQLFAHEVFHQNFNITKLNRQIHHYQTYKLWKEVRAQEFSF